MIMFGSFLPGLLVGWHHQSLPGSREPTLSWNQFRKRRMGRWSIGWRRSATSNIAWGNEGLTMQIVSSSLRQPTLRRTSALVTEWSQNWGHLDELSCHLGPAARGT